MNLSGQVALVTGSSRGIGAATAKLLAQYGASVVVNYIKGKEPAEAVVKAITAAGGKAIAVQADARKFDEVKAMVDKGTAAFGPIDILVLNAGMSVPFRMFADMSYSEFEGKVMGELQCFFQALKLVIPSMIARKKGCIIGISSGLSRYPGNNFSAHTTAKSAVDGLMKSLAFELGPHGIRVNTVAPGLVVTDATSWMPKEQFDGVARYTPLRRVGRPDDIAGVVLALALDITGFVTGTYIPVSGGVQML